MNNSEWETVIGLEIHVQLSTKSKIFSDASTVFGGEPNEQANEIDLGLPGTLPALTQRFFLKQLHLALVLEQKYQKSPILTEKTIFTPICQKVIK